MSEAVTDRKVAHKKAGKALTKPSAQMPANPLDTKI
jgi:hypothetical protein